jgi:hypothetical protein
MGGARLFYSCLKLSHSEWKGHCAFVFQLGMTSPPHCGGVLDHVKSCLLYLLFNDKIICCTCVQQGYAGLTSHLGLEQHFQPVHLGGADCIWDITQGQQELIQEFWVMLLEE